MSAWALMLVLTREFAVTGLRLVAVGKGTVIAAGWSGKIKTAATMIGLCFMIALPEQGIPIGDIVISLERAYAQAAEYGHSVDRELAFLCVHSVLHLLGYDHERSEDEDKEQRRRQEEILASIGQVR